MEASAAQAGTEARLQRPVRRPYRMIQGTRRHHWYLSRSLRLWRQVSGTGRNEPFLRRPATPPRLTIRKMLIRTETGRILRELLRPETLVNL